MLTFAWSLNEFESFIIMFFNKMNMFWCACIYIFVCACILCICVVVAAAAAVAWEKTEGNSHKLWLSEWLVFCTHSTEPSQVTRMTGLSKFSQKHNIFGTQWILRTRLCKWSEEKNFFIQERFSLRGWIWHFRYHFVCVCVCLCAMHAMSIEFGDGTK